MTETHLRLAVANDEETVIGNRWKGALDLPPIKALPTLRDFRAVLEAYDRAVKVAFDMVSIDRQMLEDLQRDPWNTFDAYHYLYDNAFNPACLGKVVAVAAFYHNLHGVTAASSGQGDLEYDSVIFRETEG